MKQLFFLFFLVNFSVSAQDYSSVDNKVKTYPKVTTAKQLANRIASDFNSEEKQVRAIFSWLAQNIRYDLEELYNPKQKRIHFRYRNEAEKQAKIQAIKNEIVKNTLLNRSAVCEGYAQTLSKVCSLLHIENQVIKGYVRNSSRDIGNILSRTNHAWNAVKLNNKWVYLDATWAAGAVTNGRWQRFFNDYYFNIPKEKYFFTHFPENKSWRLRIQPTSEHTYFNQPIYTTPFLKNNYQLVKPTTGILNNNGSPITIVLKNVKRNQSIFCGFKGYRYALEPEISFKNGVTTIKIVPPVNSNGLFLIIDKEVVLEFLIQ